MKRNQNEVENSLVNIEPVREPVKKKGKKNKRVVSPMKNIADRVQLRSKYTTSSSNSMKIGMIVSITIAIVFLISGYFLFKAGEKAGKNSEKFVAKSDAKKISSKDIPSLPEKIKQGRIIYSDGSKFIGELKNGLPHGHGKYYRFSGQLEYEGEWKIGQMDGKGVVYYSNGRKKYEGKMKTGKKYGHGTEYDTGGHRTFTGKFYENKRCGRGTFFWKNGNRRYKGQLKNDVAHGYGILYWENGNKKYEGDWKNNKFDGKGISYNPAGKKVYEGIWLENKKHGYGTLYWENGNKKYEGDYRYGDQMGGIWYTLRGKKKIVEETEDANPKYSSNHKPKDAPKTGSFAKVEYKWIQVDIVYLKDGRKLKGKIIQEGRKQIKLEMKYGSIFIKRNQIIRIKKDKIRIQIAKKSVPGKVKIQRKKIDLSTYKKALKSRYEGEILNSLRKICKLGPVAAELIPEIIKCSTYSNSGVQKEVERAIESIGSEGIPFIVKAILKDGYHVTQKIKKALVKMAIKDPRGFSENFLIAIKKDVDKNYNRFTADLTDSYLEICIKVGPILAPFVKKYLRDKNWRMRGFAAIYLIRMSKTDVSTLRYALRALRDKHPRVREWAILHLVKIGSFATPVTPDLIRILKNKKTSENIRGYIERILKNTDPKKTLIYLKRELHNQKIQITVLRVIGHFGPKALSLLPKLKIMLGRKKRTLKSKEKKLTSVNGEDYQKISREIRDLRELVFALETAIESIQEY